MAKKQKIIKDLKRLNRELKNQLEFLKEEIQEYEILFDIWNKRPLINKFNKEFSKKCVEEEKTKGRIIAGALPDAEYVYKKYYELQEENKTLKERIAYLEINNNRNYWFGVR